LVLDKKWRLSKIGVDNGIGKEKKEMKLVLFENIALQQK